MVTMIEFDYYNAPQILILSIGTIFLLWRSFLTTDHSCHMSPSILIYPYVVKKNPYKITPTHLVIFYHCLYWGCFLVISEFSPDVLMVFIIYQNPHFGNAIEIISQITQAACVV